MKRVPQLLLVAFFLMNCSGYLLAQKDTTVHFKAIVLYENGGHHIAFSNAAKPWLEELAKNHNFQVDFITGTNQLDSSFLSNYQLFIQLDYPPYGWEQKAADAFEQYINSGAGSWIGFHHASLLGEFDGHTIWPWFQEFMGGIRFKNYIADFASGRVVVEQPSHPVMNGIDPSFMIYKEEWYTYDQSPRKNVTVLASVKEDSYAPPSAIKMGDHPVVWSNPAYKAKNLYIFMGHSPDLFSNKGYCLLVKNAILWAGVKK